MKQLAFIIVVFLTFSINSNCQTPINLCKECDNNEHFFYFNDPNDSSSFYFYFDTLQINNIWEIGTISKNFFTTGACGPKALVTDTLDPYPSNNISSLKISFTNCSVDSACGTSPYYGFGLYIKMKIDSDSAKDGGTIEVSHNSSPFINIIEDPLAELGGDLYSIYDTISSMNKPGFYGKSYQWRYFFIWYEPVMMGDFDTVTFMFTFTSDSIQTYRDGWLIGFIDTKGYYVGLNEYDSQKKLTIYPNPCRNFFYVKVNDEHHNGIIEIFSELGYCLLSKRITSNPELIDISNIPNGLYFVKYTYDGNSSFKKIIIIN